MVKMNLPFDNRCKHEGGEGSKDEKRFWTTLPQTKPRFCFLDSVLGNYITHRSYFVSILDRIQQSDKHHIN
jgi:hypothetical protein